MSTQENETVFAVRLRGLIEEHGDTIADFCRETGVAPSTANNWLNYGKWPRSDSLKCVAEYYDVSADYLLGLSDIRNANKPIPRCQAPRCMMYAGDDHGLCKLHRIHVNGGDYCSYHTRCKYEGKAK